MTGSHRAEPVAGRTGGATRAGSGSWSDAASWSRRTVVIVIATVVVLVGAATAAVVATTGAGAGGGTSAVGGSGDGGAGSNGGSTSGTATGRASASASSSSARAAADPGDADAGAFQDPSPKAAAATGATPTTVTIPAIGVSTPLEDLQRDATGALAPPVDYDKAGWFRDGVVPGQLGPSVIAGHVDSPTTAAVFFRLDELVAGDQVQVAMSDGTTLAFTVQRSERAAKNAFPTSDVYGSTPTPTLRLITCDGTFDTATGHYTDNLIVFAALTGP